jgi:Uma2 family endonuclease
LNGERERRRIMASNRKDVPYHYYSLDEYYALEQASDARFEYWDGDIICMSGGSTEHAQIAGNIFFRLRLQLSGGHCRVFISDQAVKTPTLPPYRYPDVTVVCGELHAERIHGLDALINPVLIVEVLSPTTASRDHNEKFMAYQALPSFREYLLIAQDAPRITHYTRQADDSWLCEEVTDLSAALLLDSIGCRLSLSEIYEEVRFSAA